MSQDYLTTLNMFANFIEKHRWGTQETCLVSAPSYPVIIIANLCLDILLFITQF